MIIINDNGVKICNVCNYTHSFPNLDEKGNCNYCKKFNVKQIDILEIEIINLNNIISKQRELLEIYRLNNTELAKELSLKYKSD